MFIIIIGFKIFFVNRASTEEEILDEIRINIAYMKECLNEIYLTNTEYHMRVNMYMDVLHILMTNYDQNKFT